MDISGRVLLADARLHAVVALAVLAGLAPARVAAQVSVEASPLRVELKTTPGGTTTQAVTLNNTGTDAVRVRATISDWYLSVDGAPQFGAAADARYSASAWMRLAPPEQVIEPGRQARSRGSTP